MNWEAFTVIGLFTLVLGMVLYLPARFFIKRRLRSDPNRYPTIRLTRLGWLLLIVALLALLGGFSAQYVAPESALGRFVKTSGDRFLYMVIVFTLFRLVEVVLKTRGIYLTKDKPDPGSRGPSDSSR